MLPESTLLMIRTFHLLQGVFISLIMMTNWNTTFGPIWPIRVTTLERILPLQDLTSIIYIRKSNWPWKTQSTSIMILRFLQSNSHCKIILLWTLLLWGSLFAFPFTLKSAKQFAADGSLHWLCVSLFPFYVCLERKEKQATGLSSWNWYLRKRPFCFVSFRNLSFSTAKLLISMFYRSLPRFCTLLLDASAILNTSRILPSLYDP